MPKRVLMAMSGGVDSSAAALLLKQQGYKIVGAHMKLWDYADVGGDIYRDGRCCSLDAINQCRIVCDQLKAPFYVLNLSRRFEDEIIENFVTEYRAGRTPNPCVRCNTHIKWDGFLRKANELDCEYVATGHYARVAEGKDNVFGLLRGRDDTRDQSYVLWGLNQATLARTLFPLGDMLKSEVRALARQAGLRTADNTESREICFVADDDYPRFLRQWEEKKGRPQLEPGDIVDKAGQVQGQHQGIAFYTIGQRRGLGLSHPTPLYVVAINADTNQVVVGEDEDNYRTLVLIENVNWISRPPIEGRIRAEVQIRYQHRAAAAALRRLDEATVAVAFDDPQRAITPGQSAVFYDNEAVLGGGVIASQSDNGLSSA